jgi:hypothetical protein
LIASGGISHCTKAFSSALNFFLTLTQSQNNIGALDEEIARRIFYILSSPALGVPILGPLKPKRWTLTGLNAGAP